MRKHFLLFSLLLLGLSACTVPVVEEPPATSSEAAEHLFSQGEYTQAAIAFARLAEQASPPEHNRLLLRAAAALAAEEHILQARQLLDSTQLDEQDPLQGFLYNLARSHLALAEREPQVALIYLEEVAPAEAEPPQLAEYHLLRANAYTMLGNRLETAHELVLREPHLTDADAIRDNQHRIWQALATLTERGLQQLRTAPPPDIFSGWMELVQIAKAYQLNPDMLREQLNRWQSSYPNHPVLPEILAGLTSRRQEDVTYPDRIALLLPLSGKFSQAGQAVRDGFMAAYYTHSPSESQELHLYDTESDPTGIDALYQQAVADGAQFIVGPLRKESVQILAQQKPLPVPTLGLNYQQEETSQPDNLYQFGLSPEEEARQVAERAWLDGHVNAVVMVPAGPWGERVQQSFQERWEYMGGKVVESQSYDPRQNDFSGPIKKLLNIDDSQRRYRSLSLLIKSPMKFTPRRRQDVDFIFLAAYPRQARQIRPQFKFFHAARVPIYATSHVFTGNLNAERDRDMDGMAFGDMPWVLSESSMYRGLRAEIEPYITPVGNSLQRLYALGIDAFNIIGALNPLRNYPYERFDGETGGLSLDAQLRVHRQLIWVVFRSGQPVVMDQIDQ